MNARMPMEISCKYCANQGIKMSAQKLHGQDSKTVYPDTTRYGCENGHKFAIPDKDKLPS